MRVLHLITTLDRGGAENALLWSCRALAGRGDDGAVGYLKGPGELAGEFLEAGIRVEDLALGRARVDRALGGARRLLATFRPDVVHTHLFKADTLGATVLPARGPDVPVLVSTKHNEDVYLRGGGVRARTFRALGRRAAARADAVVAVSEGVAAFVREVLEDAPRRLTTIRYGVPEPRPVPDGAAADLRRRLGIPAGAPLLLCPARLDEQKDHATLLDAVGRLPPDAGAVLLLLGRGPLEDDLRARAAFLGDRVVFGGFLPDPGPAYVAADLLVLASRHEGLGLVLVEAAQRGVPAVATRVGGIPEVVEDGVTGRLVPPGDAAALADAITALLRDPARRRSMGDAARRHVGKRFGHDRAVAATRALYTDLLAARG